jgi:hypothetical protein
MSVSQELQELVQLQQMELQRLQQQQEQQQQQHARPYTLNSPARTAAPSAVGLEAANSELRRQLQGATSRLQDMEAAMARLLDQQVCWGHGTCRQAAGC